MLFPLELTPFESMMWRDDRANHPMNFFIVCELRGSLDRGKLLEALAVTIERQPLLRARLASRRGRWFWVAGEPQPPAVWWLDDPTCDAPFWRKIDLRRESGMRVFVEQDGEQVRMFFQFHHTTSDGVGGFVIVGDVLAEYHRRVTGRDEDVSLRTLDEAQLHTRRPVRPAPRATTVAGAPPPVAPTPAPSGDTASTGSPPAPVAAPGFLANLWMTLRFVFYRPTAIATRKTRGKVRPFFGNHLIGRRLSTEQIADLRRRAVAANATVNDVLMAELFIWIDRWNSQRTPGATNRLRLTIPTNLRPPRDKQRPAANMMSYGFIDRSTAEIRQPEKLLTTLSAENRSSIREQTVYNLLTGLWIIDRLPGLLWSVLRLPICFSTAVLSNVGDSARRFTARVPRRDDGRVVAGDLVVEDLWGVPPVRPRTSISIAVLTYNGGLTVGLLGDPERLSPADSRAFLDGYVEQVTAATTPAAEPATVASST